MSIDFRKELNPEQFAAATAADGPMLVLAAAGTGKTRTLVHRVAYLVEQGVPAERMLLLTFTNKAAREMLERAEKLVPSVSGIWSGTFHHVCARFLRQWGSFLGYNPGFQIVDEDDAKKLMAQCIKDNVKDAKDFVKKEFILKLISDAANRELDFEEFVLSQQSKVALDVEAVLKVAKAYHARKRELGVMDFDDLLVNGLKLVRESERVRAFLQDHFRYIMVDEYQDTNTLQSQLTDILAAKHRNLMVVGDDFQCIYTWRGAQFENIMNFPMRWPGCKVVKLERNYRSLQPVLDVANFVMKDVPHQFEKTLRPARTQEGSLPELLHMYDSRTQADAVVELVRRMHEGGTRYENIAVLYRSHFSSIDIQLSLTRAHIPFRITSGVGVFEQLHVKDVLAFLRVCVNVHAELSFTRLVCLFPGVGEAGAKKMWLKLGGAFDGSNPMDRMNLESILPSKAKDAWAGVKQAFERASSHLAAHEDRKLVEDFTKFFYADYLHKQFEAADAESRLEDFTELMAHIATAEGGLKGFLAEVALMTNLDRKARVDFGGDQLLLSTIHQAKGMEWPVVILPWLVEGVFPSQRSVDDGNVDEERRLFYVAVTRAKDRLIMLVPKSRKSADGGQFPVNPSRFIRELPKGLLQEFNVRTSPASLLESERAKYAASKRYGSAYGASAYGKPRTSYTTSWRR